MKLEAKSFSCGLLVGAALVFMIIGTIAAIGFLTHLSSSQGAAEISPSPPMESIPVAGDIAVTDALKPILREHNLPSLAAGRVTSKGLQQMGVVGFRKRDTDVAVTPEDLWHLGSDGKAMTATLIARLVERGELDWTTTMAEVFPDLAEGFHPDMRSVTIEQLLTHRSGLSGNLSLARYQGRDVRKLRHRAVRNYLAKPPSHPPGSHMAYSNLGYIVAGAVVEATLDKTWEEAMQKEVFGPLSMDSAGFGGTGTKGEIDQPWPHGDTGVPKSKNGPSMDNPPVMGPAGRIHCSMADWGKFIQDHLRGARGEPGTLLQPATYTTLHTPPADGEYAYGWLVIQRDWGDGTVLHHGGDNTMNNANVWIAPNCDFAVFSCANQGGQYAAKATDSAVSAMIRLTPNDEADRE
jgi:CubicO group peptidase (beta-lactamase class C family)